MNNHAVKADGFRYIRYEDGKEELYDHSSDPNEWKNLANNPQYKHKIKKLKEYLPQKNLNWDSESNYTFQPYFVEQKGRIKKIP